MNQYGFYDYYGYMPDAQASAGVEAGAVVGVIFGVILAFYFLVFAMGIVFYVLQSMGIYTIAKRRGIRKPWLAWLPIGDAWTLGSISDQYQYVKCGKVTNRRKTLVILYVVILAAVALVVGSIIGTVVGAAFSNGGAAVVGVGSTVLSYFVIIGACIAMAVIEYIALYDVFRSCNPDSSAVFLILGILFPVTLPFFLFFSRKKDEGMPPRKETKLEQLLEAVSLEEEDAVSQEESTEE